MNGREFFKKHSGIIKFLTKAMAVLPRGFREKKLISLRYKDGKIAMLRRYFLIRTLVKSCGDNVAVFPGVFFENIDKLSIGNNVSIHQMCYIDAEGGIEIGDDVSVAHRSTVLSSNHRYNGNDIPIKYQGMILKKNVISDNVWIGCGCTILAGVTIGCGCVVGANSTVTKDLPENAVVGGTPAKIIKNRLDLQS